ncbi:hypothetical protein BDY24DRAFT_440559 [Mrakia frigida]|uniref:uncharacterized protein n=1 Tax=Mrakia frigida TaxID=29902 RepID=UPI003FCC0214
MDSLSSLTSSLPSPTISTGSTQDLSIPVSNLLLCEYCSRSLAKISRCARCKLVSYCSQACQKKDWKVHKLVCGSSTGRKRLPDLPIEVLERILKYTFLRRSKLTPFSDPFHLNGTSFLLLLSKGFRELCLPFFYHTLAITRSSHYAVFFAPTDGIFSAGEVGEKRWNFVKELALVRGAFPPLVDPPRAVINPPLSFCFVDLTIPSRRNLERVCLLEPPNKLAEDIEADPAVQNLISSVQADDFLRSRTRSRIWRYKQSGGWSEESIRIEVDEVLRQEVLESISDERDRFSVRRLLPSLRPIAYQVSTSSLQPIRQYLLPVDRRALGSYTELSLCYSPSVCIAEISCLYGLLRCIASAQATYGRAPQLRLDSVPSSVLLDFKSWLEGSKRDRTGPLSSREWRLFSWTRTFVWELEDGTSVSITSPITEGA